MARILRRPEGLMLRVFGNDWRTKIRPHTLEAAIPRALSALRPMHRAVISEVYLGILTVGQIAGEYQLHPNSVGNIIDRAIKDLRATTAKWLSPLDPSEIQWQSLPHTSDVRPDDFVPHFLRIILRECEIDWTSLTRQKLSTVSLRLEQKDLALLEDYLDFLGRTYPLRANENTQRYFLTFTSPDDLEQHLNDSQYEEATAFSIHDFLDPVSQTPRIRVSWRWF